MFMAKNVAFSEKAYKELSKRKMSGESFSDLVIRLISTSEGTEKPSWRDSIGAFKGDKDAERIFDKILNERHKKPLRPVKW